jgi:uncharacterized Ntn-hydrolase superfamily protein
MWVRTGDDCRPHASHIVGDGWAVSGNFLTSRQVVEAMAEAMTGSADEELAERLLRALEAGRDAGGQTDHHKGEHVRELSTALFVVDGEHPYPKVDLRVDYHPEAVDHLRRLYDYCKPLDAYYEGLQFHPDRLDRFLEERGVKKMPHMDWKVAYRLE